MNLRYLIFTLYAISAAMATAAVAISGSRVVTISPEPSTGLSAVYVVEDSSEAEAIYSGTDASSVRWYSFGSAGAAYAEQIDNVTVSGTSSSIPLSANDRGYIVESAGRQTYFWVTNYASHQPTMSAISVNLAESDCETILFDATGGFDRIYYYSINGARQQLDRQIELIYNSLEFETSEDEDSGNWKQFTTTTWLPYVENTIRIVAPLCNTDFTLTGDRFLRQWDNPISFAISSYDTRRVDARTYAVQAERDADNEQNVASSGLGGSAPCIVTFRAYPTDAVVFREWQFSPTEDFNDVTYRFNEDDLTYTFTEYGTTYVRYTCADASGDCTYDGDVYTVMIGESKLLCPNAFSPHNQDGVNDLWKVSYSSLVSYECHIFNRWGKQLFSSTNPAEGWDGRVGGKFVPSGVYFYVIKAVGSDGVKYDLSGDINIIGSKIRNDGFTSEE